MNKQLAIIVPTYNSHKILKELVDCLKQQANTEFRAYVVDVSGNKKRVDFNNHRFVLCQSKNKGYAHAVNIGLKQAVKNGHDHFCIVNDDVILKENFVQKSIDSLIKHPNSIIGGKIYYAPGYEYHKRRYDKGDLGRVIWYAGGSFDWNHVLTPHRGVDEVDVGQYDKFERTDFVSGCLVLFDKKVLETVGFWNESYFLYYEDADFCVHAVKKGVSLYYDPSIIIWHKISSSTGGSGSVIHQKFQGKNRLRFGLKYAPLQTKFYLLKNYFFDFLRKREKI